MWRLIDRPIRNRRRVTLHRGGASRQKFRLPIGPWSLDPWLISQSTASLDLTSVWPKAAFLMVAWWRASPLLDRSHFSGWTSAPEWTSWSLWDIRRRFLTFSGLKWGDVELSCRSWIMWVKMCFGHGSENQNYSIRVFTSCGAGCHSAWRKRSSITGNHVSARSAWQWMGLNIHLIRSVLPCALARTNKPSEITIDLVCICIMSLKGMRCACFTVNPWVLTPLWPRDRERDSPFTADRAAEVAGKTEPKCL